MPTGLPSRRGTYSLERRPFESDALIIWVYVRPFEGTKRKRRVGRSLAKYFKRMNLDVGRHLNDRNCMRVVDAIHEEIAKRDAASRAATPGDPTPLGALVAHYGVALEARGRSPRHVSETLRRLSQCLGQDTQRPVAALTWRTLDNMSRRGLADYLRARAAAGAGPDETNHDLAAWRAFGSWLLDEGRITANPFMHMRAAHVPDRPPQALTSKQILAFLEACRRSSETRTKENGKKYRNPGAPDWLYPTVLLMSSTGLRPIEVARLDWARVDLRRHTVTVLGKAGEHDVVDLPEVVVAYLKRTPREKREGPVVPGFPYREGATYPGNYSRAVRTAAKEAGLEGVSLYWLRHSVATELARQGLNSKQIQQVLRHRTSRMADRYVHLVASDVAGVTDHLPWVRSQKRKRKTAKKRRA